MTTAAFFAALTAGCAATKPEPQDRIDVLLAAPEAQVRSATIQVLIAAGYLVEPHHEGGRAFTSGYRQEMDGPWDWLLSARFGVNRSWVVVTLTPETSASTRLSIDVRYEAKDGPFRFWQPSEDIPLALTGLEHLRLIRNALGLF